MLNILFIHQSAEMYGSDKTLLFLLKELDRHRFRPIVLLPSEGPLKDALEANGIEVHAIPLVRAARATLSIGALLRLPWEIGRSLRAMNRVLNGLRISIVHSNTLAVLSGALWAKWHRIPHVWHVHEMIVHPKLARKAFPLLLRFFADRVACNSRATRQLLLDSQPVLAKKSVIIWNGLDREFPPDHEMAQEFREELQVSPDEVLVVLMGRINRLKGQRLLVEAAGLISRKGLGNIRYLIVGSTPPGQAHFLTNLREAIAASKVAAQVSIMDFQENIWRIWDAADIAVVPSTEPESFGMVALEAMVAGKPVVAAAHGGLLDIVEDGITGTLVAPGNPGALAEAIAALAGNKQERDRMGKAGFARAGKYFGMKQYVQGFEHLYEAAGEKDL